MTENKMVPVRDWNIATSPSFKISGVKIKRHQLKVFLKTQAFWKNSKKGNSPS